MTPLQDGAAVNPGRSDGWTPQVRQAFLASLAADGSVQQAAKDVGRDFTSAYRLRARDAVFRAAWDAAIAMAHAFGMQFEKLLCETAPKRARMG